MAEFQTQGPRLRSDIIRKTEKPPRDYSSWTVLAVIIVLLIIVFGWIIYSIRQDTNSTEVINRCNPGLCAFDILSGIKRCPANDSEQIGYDVGIEYCTSRNYCQKTKYTCAVQLDQSIDCSGVCGPGNDQCRCIKNPTSAQ